jgi:hypothetical protein
MSGVSPSTGSVCCAFAIWVPHWGHRGLSPSIIPQPPFTPGPLPASGSDWAAACAGAAARSRPALTASECHRVGTPDRLTSYGTPVRPRGRGARTLEPAPDPSSGVPGIQFGGAKAVPRATPRHGRGGRGAAHKFYCTGRVRHGHAFGLLPIRDKGRTLQVGECVTRASRALTGDRARVIAFSGLTRGTPASGTWRGCRLSKRGPAVKRCLARSCRSSGPLWPGQAGPSRLPRAAFPEISDAEHQLAYPAMNDTIAMTSTNSANNASATSRPWEATEVDLQRRQWRRLEALLISPMCTQTSVAFLELRTTANGPPPPEAGGGGGPSCSLQPLPGCRNLQLVSG